MDFIFKNPSKSLLLFITIVLFIIPFFWLPYGTMDLGGDTTRLFFYDPVVYLKNLAFYGIFPEGFNGVSPNYYLIPFLLLLISLKWLLSSYILITLFNSIKLAIGFLAMYAVIKEFINRKISNYISDYAAILGGLFYTLSRSMTGNYDKALLSHNQVFLNPLVFFLLLKFFLTKQYRFALFFLLLSVLFAPSFSYDASPPFLAFYPLVLVFLILYVLFVRKQSIPWKKSCVILLFFIGLQAFQLVPQVLDLFSSGSFTNTRVFDRASIISDGVRYFISLLPLSKVSTNILLPSWNVQFIALSFLVPAIVILGFILKKKKDKALPLTGVFFLISLYLLSANITRIGVAFYTMLFYVPGFSVFRDFIGQWLFVFSFFYALLFGQALAYLFEKLPKKLTSLVLLFIAFVTIVSAWDFIDGNLVNPLILTTPRRHIATTMDPTFIQSMYKVQNLPEGKVVIFPFSDTFYEVVPGVTDGVYISSSMLSYIGGRSSFSGYQIMQPFSPGSRSSFSGYQIKEYFSEDLFRLAREKKYQDIQKLLGLLDIRYIFYYANPAFYDHITPDYYQYARQSLPPTQQAYKAFISELDAKEIYSAGYYKIYKLPDSYFLPQFFIADTACYTKKGLCDASHKLSQEVAFKENDPTSYALKIKATQKPFVLVFSNAFHPDWALSTNSSLKIGEHFVVNDYANAWYMLPANSKNHKDFTFALVLKSQQIFYLCLVVSIFFFLLLLCCFIFLFFHRKSCYNEKHD